jgi:diaminopimelate epimerase
MRLTIMSGAGNRFAVVDVPRHGAPSDAAALARYVCAQWGTDGLLLAAPPETSAAAARMILYNADGSRPEACGNGLRCVAKFVRDRGYVATDAFTIETDAGPREVELERSACTPRVTPDVAPVVTREVTGARVSMGPVRLIDPEVSLSNLPPVAPFPTTANAFFVSVGNPHAVLLVDDERTAPVAVWGAAIERDAHFPNGANVGFLASRDGSLWLRVWERGVGETLACGSGACAAAAVAVHSGLAPWPVVLHLPGGQLGVNQLGTNVSLTGPAECLGELEFEGELASPPQRPFSS